MSRAATPLRTTFVLAIGLLAVASAVPMTAMAGTLAEPEVFDPSRDAHAGVAAAQVGANGMPSDGMWDLTRIYVSGESLDSVFLTIRVHELDDAAGPRPLFTADGQYGVPEGAVEESSVLHEVMFTHKGQTYKAVASITKFRINDDPATQAQRLASALAEDLAKADALARSLRPESGSPNSAGTKYLGPDDIEVPTAPAELWGLIATINGTIESLEHLDEEIGNTTNSIYPTLYSAVGELGNASRDPAGYAGQHVAAAKQALEDAGVPTDVPDPFQAVNDAILAFRDATDDVGAALNETVPSDVREAIKRMSGNLTAFVDNQPMTFEEYMAEKDKLVGEIGFVSNLVNTYVEPADTPDVGDTYNETEDLALEALGNATDLDWWNGQLEALLTQIDPYLAQLYAILEDIPTPDDLLNETMAIKQNLEAAVNDTDAMIEGQTGLSILKAKESAENLVDRLTHPDFNDLLPDACSYDANESVPIECNPGLVAAMIQAELQKAIDAMPEAVQKAYYDALAAVSDVQAIVNETLAGAPNPWDYVPDIFEELNKTEATLDMVQSRIPPQHHGPFNQIRENYTALRGQLEAIGSPLISNVPTQWPVVTDGNGDGLPDLPPVARADFGGPTHYAVTPAASVASIIADLDDATGAFEDAMEALGVKALVLPEKVDMKRALNAPRELAPSMVYAYQAWLEGPAGQRVGVDSVMDVKADSVTVRLPRDLVGLPKKQEQMTQIWATSWVGEARMDMAPQPKNAGAGADTGQALSERRLVEPAFGRAYSFVHDSFGGNPAGRIAAEVLGTPEATVREGGFTAYTVEVRNPGPGAMRGIVTLNAPAAGWTHQVDQSILELDAGQSTMVVVTVAKIAAGAPTQVTTVSFTPEGGQTQQVTFTTSSESTETAGGGKSPGLGLALVLGALGLVGVVANRRRRE